MMKSGRQIIRPLLAGLLFIALVLGPLSVLSYPLFATASPSASATSTAPAETPAAEPAAVYPQALVVPQSAPSAVVIEANRGRLLYEKNTQARLVLPAANKIMTAIIAAEKLPLETKITISKIAAAVGASEATEDRITLNTGDKYTLEYLLLRLLFYDSDAAAVAIAEHISNGETEFVKLMNAWAIKYGLANTVYANSSGKPVVLSDVKSGTEPTNNPQMTSGQYTTIANLATLMQLALLNEKFSRLFQKQSDYIVLDGKTLVPMVNRVSRLWPYSEGRVKGAFLSETSVYTCITVGTVKGFNIISVTAMGDSSQVVNDVLALFNAVERTYENTPLVQVSDVFTGAQETTLDGEVFGLVYQKTVNYVHPIGDPYLKSNVRYTSFGPYSRPIQRSMTVGQVIFELIDGTPIAVDVGPDRQILSSISLVDKALVVLQTNRNLYNLIIVSVLLLLLTLIVRLLGWLSKLIRQLRTSTSTLNPPGGKTN